MSDTPASASARDDQGAVATAAGSSPLRSGSTGPADAVDGVALQERLLPGVSRTFALTIPQLPGALRVAVTNAYLLCRIADTIEDDVALDPAQKRRFHDRFIAVVGGEADGAAFAEDLAPRLSADTKPEERDLVARSAEVVAVTHSLRPGPRRALERCIQIMCSGMPTFQQQRSLSGLPSVADLQRYCYFVAGVVGEMLTDLFCDHHPDIRSRRDRLMPLAVSFGQGLQMTNILKDFWEDRKDATCWLPRDVFHRHGLDLADADSADTQAAFAKGLNDLIGIAHGSLRRALDYVHLIPAGEAGIRRFCLWAIGLAMLTLQNIRRHPDYRDASQVKVSRGALRATVMISNLSYRYNTLLSMLFDLLSVGLPDPVHPRLGRARTGTTQ